MKEKSKLNTNIKYTNTNIYSEVLIIRPPMELVESGLYSEQVSLKSAIYIEKCIFGTESNGLNSQGGLNSEWSL